MRRNYSIIGPRRFSCWFGRHHHASTISWWDDGVTTSYGFCSCGKPLGPV